MHKLFPGLQKGEVVHLVVRQHWIILVGRVLIWFMFAAALMLFNNYAPDFAPFLLEGTVGQIVGLFKQVYVLFLLLTLLIIWVLYYLNSYIITAERIVDINQIGLFSHVISELNIEKIEDVTSEVHGVLGHIFDYGLVHIQTAGTKERFKFDHIPNPGSVTKLILKLYEEQTKNNPPLPHI